MFNIRTFQILEKVFSGSILLEWSGREHTRYTNSKFFVCKIKCRNKLSETTTKTYWPDGCQASRDSMPTGRSPVASANRISSSRITTRDWLRIIIITGLLTICLWLQFYYCYVTSYAVYTDGGKTLIWILTISMQINIFTIPIVSLWKRQRLLKIISINQNFDRKVSVQPTWSENCPIT